MFPRPTEYAIRAMTFLAAQPSGKLTGAREMARSEKIPMPFLWKILQTLARRKLIRSFRGARGGYELARPADQITLKDIAEATDGSGVVEDCVLGLPQCNEENPCPLHHTWKELKGRLEEILDKTTLADLAEVARRRKLEATRSS